MAGRHSQPGGWGWRHVQILMTVLCVTSGITMRVCLSMAIVAMTSKSSHEGDVMFNWEGTKKSTVLGAFLWGYCVTQVAGGALSSWGWASRWMSGALVLSGILTMLLPAVAIAMGEDSWIAVAAIRFAEGFAQGMLYPSSYTLIGRWAPPLERARAGALILAAQPIGNIIAMAVSGVIASTWGWPAIFYFFGVLSLVIALAFLSLSADHPNLHPHISSAERDFITSSIQEAARSKSSKQPPTPWKAMITSPPLWFNLVAHLGYLWGYWVTLTCIPTYIENLLPELNLTINGVISALPYVLMLIFSLFFGWLGDFVEKKKLLPLSVNRKLLNSIGNWGPALLMVVLALLGTSSPVLSVAVLIFSVGILSAIFSGSLLNPVDLAPNHSGVAFSLTNMIGSIFSAFAPFAEGLFVDKQDPIPGWSNVFYVTAGVHLVANLVWVLYGSTDVQPWNDLQAANINDDKNIEPKEKINGSDYSTFNDRPNHLDRETTFSEKVTDPDRMSDVISMKN